MRKIFSSNFVMDQVLKQKFYEIQNMFYINENPKKKEENYRVNILKLEKRLKFIFFKKLVEYKKTQRCIG